MMMLPHEKRYARQTVLPEVGLQGQEKLHRARALVIGAGGLGCPALQYLAAAGVGTLGIVDDDVIDLSNLQRQILFTTAQQGQKKATTAAIHLRALNPGIAIQAYAERFCAANALSLLKDYDVIIDGTDNFSSRFLINDAAVKCGKPVVYGSILGFEGQASVFWARKGPCYRCYHPAPPSAYVPNCAQAGTIGAIAGMIGAMQAMEAIKIILDHESLRPLTGTLLMVDGRALKSFEYAIPKNPSCPCCSKKPEDIMLADHPVSACGIFEEIGVQDAEMMKEKGAVFIDVREQDEWDEGHIEGAIHFALSRLMNGDTLPPQEKGAPLIIYCRSGRRSRTAIEILARQECENLFNLREGYEGWRFCVRKST